MYDLFCELSVNLLVNLTGSAPLLNNSFPFLETFFFYFVNVFCSVHASTAIVGMDSQMGRVYFLCLVVEKIWGKYFSV